MKIAELIVEEEYSESEIVELIKRNCGPYLLQWPVNPVFRGVKGKPDKAFKQSVRSDRKPRDSSLETHNAIDDWFLKKFGFKARSETVFVTGDYKTAKKYGKVYAVFPIGEFKFVWSPDIKDLGEEVGNDDIADIHDILDDSYFDDDHLGIAIGSKNEIMIKCKEYYAVPINGKQDIQAMKDLFEEFRVEHRNSIHGKA